MSDTHATSTTTGLQGCDKVDRAVFAQGITGGKIVASNSNKCESESGDAGDERSAGEVFSGGWVV